MAHLPHTVKYSVCVKMLNTGTIGFFQSSQHVIQMSLLVEMGSACLGLQDATWTLTAMTCRMSYNVVSVPEILFLYAL